MWRVEEARIERVERHSCSRRARGGHVALDLCGSRCRTVATHRHIAARGRDPRRQHLGETRVRGEARIRRHVRNCVEELANRRPARARELRGAYLPQPLDGRVAVAREHKPVHEGRHGRLVDGRRRCIRTPLAHHALEERDSIRGVAELDTRTEHRGPHSRLFRRTPPLGELVERRGRGGRELERLEDLLARIAPPLMLLADSLVRVYTAVGDEYIDQVAVRVGVRPA